MEYKFRNLPMKILPENELYCVSGNSGSGVGILEWCYSQTDANYIKSEMEKDDRFSNISAHKFLSVFDRNNFYDSEYKKLWAYLWLLECNQASLNYFLDALLFDRYTVFDEFEWALDFLRNTFGAK